MKREEAKAKFVRGAEEMFEEMWEWGEENPQRVLMRWQASWRDCGEN